MATFVMVSPSRNFTTIEALGCGAINGAQMLLLAAWLGLSGSSPRKKLFVSTLGTSYLAALWAICAGRGVLAYLAETFALVATLTALLTIFFAAVKRFVLRPVRQSRGASHIRSFQFSTLSLLIITAGVGVAIAAGRAIRSAGGETLGIGVFIVSVAAFGSIVMLLLLWAGLGEASPVRRLPASIAFASLLGLFPPLYIGGPLWRFYTWPILSTMIAIVVGLTLLALRPDGIRLVRVRSRLTDALAPIQTSK